MKLFFCFTFEKTFTSHFLKRSPVNLPVLPKIRTLVIKLFPIHFLNVQTYRDLNTVQ